MLLDIPEQCNVLNQLIFYQIIRKNCWNTNMLGKYTESRENQTKTLLSISNSTLFIYHYDKKKQTKFCNIFLKNLNIYIILLIIRL